jgi:hypothetical protein
VKTGDYLGDLTDELEEFGSGSYIEEYVLGGPKNCIFCFLPLNRETYNEMQSEG